MKKVREKDGTARLRTCRGSAGIVAQWGSGLALRICWPGVQNNGARERDAEVRWRERCRNRDQLCAESVGRRATLVKGPYCTAVHIK
eukprot:15476369-Alexandrium_andersonii.AAC.1